ncbi:unnamed protein product [Symbiodinium sp. KB8]|nr:unnamed protein product [Symbiodinium sp. KB8]
MAASLAARAIVRTTAKALAPTAAPARQLSLLGPVLLSVEWQQLAVLFAPVRVAVALDAASKAQASLQVGASCDEIKHTVEELEAKLSKHYDV